MGNAAGLSRPHRALLALSLCLAWPVQAETCPPVETLVADPLPRAFTQLRHLKGMAKPIVSTGLAQATETAFVWQVCDPFDIRTVIDQQGVRQWVEGTPEPVTGPEIVQDTIRRIGIAQIFRGNFTALERDFQVEHSTDAGKWRIDLTPRADTIRAVVGHIAVSGCTAIEQIEIQYRHDSRDEITMGAVSDGQDDSRDGAVCPAN